MVTAKPLDTADASAIPIRVLIVDNDAAHAAAMAESLERVGYECTVATSGAAGAAQLEENLFDIVITDLVMTDIDGLAILKRAKESQPEAEVILVTGHGTVPSAVSAMQQGAYQLPVEALGSGAIAGRDRKRGR